MCRDSRDSRGRVRGARGFTGRLLCWYRENARDLPWRRSVEDPYRVWVSEIMLQQTRVEAVIPYYERFIRSFPTLDALASATREDVLRHWQGLGYYRRAHLLHEGARWMLRERGGRYPRSRDEWRLVPGVGAYTAGALASICYGEPVGAVDGNVRRVFARWFAWETPLDRGPGMVRLSRAARLFAGWSGDPGAWNQAVMELGARVCVPARPRCGECPVRVYCRGERSGNPAAFSRVRKRALPVRHAMWVWAPLTEEGWWVRRRSVSGLWAGLWEFPGTPCEEGCAKWSLAWSRFQGEAAPRTTVAEVNMGEEFQHRLTHREYGFRPVFLRLTGAPRVEAGAATRLVGDEELMALPMSVPQQRIRAWARVCAEASTA